MVLFRKLSSMVRLTHRCGELKLYHSGRKRKDRWRINMTNKRSLQFRPERDFYPSAGGLKNIFIRSHCKKYPFIIPRSNSLSLKRGRNGKRTKQKMQHISLYPRAILANVIYCPRHNNARHLRNFLGQVPEGGSVGQVERQRQRRVDAVHVHRNRRLAVQRVQVPLLEKGEGMRGAGGGDRNQPMPELTSSYIVRLLLFFQREIVEPVAKEAKHFENIYLVPGTVLNVYIPGTFPDFLLTVRVAFCSHKHWLHQFAM